VMSREEAGDNDGGCVVRFPRKALKDSSGVDDLPFFLCESSNGSASAPWIGCRTRTGVQNGATVAEGGENES
jgi:hypothetical protein